MRHFLIEVFVVVTLLIFPILGVQSGAGECRRFVGARTLECYDCDSRYDDYCDHIDKNNLTSPKPRTKACQGCCVKFFHKFPERTYVQRTCTEHIIINYFMVDHVCMSEGKGRGKMCFCEDRLCNAGPSRVNERFQVFLFILILGLLRLM